MTQAVPTIDTRILVPKEIILELISQIALQFQPKKIILFGSYAYEKPRPESDVDLLIIMGTQLRESEQALRNRHYVKPVFGVDILVYSPSRLE